MSPAANGVVTAVVTDIEGTTSAISFVKETLFPFAEAALDGFLDAHGAEPAIAAQLDAVRARHPGQDPRAVLRQWMAEDAKETPLKAIQGAIWRQGFESGALRGHLYPDVAPALRRWAAAGLRLCVYSSGSVEAQRLLFGYSVDGDLGPALSGFFDTTTGPKKEAASYAAIAAGLHLPPAEILFLSDIEAELDAAAASGLLTCQLVRSGDNTVASDRHPTAPDFPAVSRRFGLPGGNRS